MRAFAVFAVFSLIAFIYFSGCTKEDEAEFDKALMDAAKQEAKNSVKNMTGGLLFGGNSTPEKKGECRFDSDCAAACEGSTYWKKGCDAQTDKCVKTFDYDCSSQHTNVGEFSFEKICTKSGCADDTASIQAKKSELIAEANQYSAAMQQTTKFRQIAAKNCISALSEVTDKLIIDTAVSMSSPTVSMAGVYSDTAKQAVDTLGGAAAGSSRMSAEEFISLNCNAMKALDTDFAVQSKKRDIAMEKAKAFAGY